MNGDKKSQESGKRQFVLRKAYEISYAVFRIASRMGSVALREHLERQALSLLDAAAVENYAWVSTVSRAVEYLMRFGGDVGLIHDANKETVLEELASLELVVAGTEKPASAELVPLDDIFAAQEPLFRKSQSSERSQSVMQPVVLREEQPPSPEYPTETSTVSAEVHHGPASSNSANNPEIRQSAILEKIRQSGNCRLRDLLEILPEFSERTLRYDLQTLAQQNLIERIGSGGPAVFYRIRQAA